MPKAEGQTALSATGFFTLAMLAVLMSGGCANSSSPNIDDRRAVLEDKISQAGLSRDARVQAARSELEAAIAREGDQVLLDSVELRAAAVTEDETRMDALVRLPIGNALATSAMRDARRADSRVALAELSEAVLQSRAELCMPSLRHEAEAEDQIIFSNFQKQQRALIEWNEDLRRSGLVNEIRWSRFKLASNVRLSRGDSPRSGNDLGLYGLDHSLNVLPSIESNLSLLDGDVDLLREKLGAHQPEVEIHRARQGHYEAMAKGESMKRLPSVRFVDFGFEPIPESGDERQYTARVAFDIPFGREAGAKTRRYEALARAEISDQRQVLDARVREAKSAINEINFFRGRSKHWRDLLAMADASEQVAASWWRDKRSNPAEIAKLLDTVYSARMTVLKARERAGAAGCTLLAATGFLVSEW